MPQPYRPQRLLAGLAAVGMAAAGMLAMPGSAHADGDGWRDGWCRDGEGQTVVVDWRSSPEALPGVEPQLIRCIQLDPDNPQYPDDSETGILKPIVSAGIEFGRDVTGFLVTINGVTAATPFSWHWSTGQASLEEGEDYWRGQSDWNPQAETNSFVGVTLSDTPDEADGFPVAVPQFDPSEPEEPEPEEPGPENPGPENPGPEEPAPEVPAPEVPAPQPPPAQKPPPAPQPPAGPPPAPVTPTASPTATATDYATQRPTRTRRPTNRPPRQTYRPEQPPYYPPAPMDPPPPPVQEPPPFMEDPPPAPPEDTSGQATAAPNPTPSRVWGREDVKRQNVESVGAGKPAPWSQLAAVAGAVVVIGGLGTAFARGLQTSVPPVVEEE